MEKLTYVAATDSDGCIAHVWVYVPGDRCARFFDPEKRLFDPEVSAEFVGASPMAIMSWLAAEQSILRRPDLHVQLAASSDPPPAGHEATGGRKVQADGRAVSGPTRRNAI